MTQRSTPVTEHTPLPWKYVPWHIEEGPSAVRAPDGHLICSTASDANAALIAKAVNSYDALIAVAEAARSYFMYAVQDEANERECCVDDEQHRRAIALRDALASIKDRT